MHIHNLSNQNSVLNTFISEIRNVNIHKDSMRLMKLDKVKKTDLPKDSLGIFDVQTGKTERIPMVKSFKIPKEWAGYLVYQKEVEEIPTNIKIRKSQSFSIAFFKVFSIGLPIRISFSSIHRLKLSGR